MKEIIDLYNLIFDIYGRLWLMDLENRNGDDCFNNLIESLRECIKNEERLFSNLIKCYQYDYDKLKMLIMKDTSINDLIRKRMYDYIMLYQMVYSKNIDAYSNVDKLNRLYMSGFRNMYLLYFSYLDEKILEEDDNKIKAILLDLKYMESFYNHDMESMLLMNNFLVPVSNYIDLGIVDCLINLSCGMDEVIANYVDILLGLVVDILEVKDIEYDDELKKISLIKNKCMFRACSSLIDDDIYEDIGILKVLFDNANDDNKKSVELIISILNNRYNDIERVKRLSLKI